MSAVAVGDYWRLRMGVICRPVTLTCVCVCERVNVGKQAAASDNAVTDTRRLCWGPSQPPFLAEVHNTFSGLKCSLKEVSAEISSRGKSSSSQSVN